MFAVGILMDYTISPNMGLRVPGVGTDAGPQYATDINTSLSTIDQHNHSSGSGVQITPSGLNINTALTFNSNFATGLAGLTLVAQSSAPGSNGTVYQAASNDLWYVNGTGTPVQITNGNSIAGATGSIGGLTAPASVNYNSSTQIFKFQSNTNVAASLDVASVILRNTSPNSTFGVTLSPQTAIPANYTLTLPGIPGVQSFVTLDNSGGNTGTFAPSIPVAGGLTSSNLSASANIAGSQLSSSANIAGTQLSSSANILGSQLSINANIVAVQMAGDLSATQMTMTDSATSNNFRQSITSNQTATIATIGTSVTTMSNFTLTPTILKPNRPLFFIFKGELDFTTASNLQSSGISAASVAINGVTGGTTSVINNVNLITFPRVTGLSGCSLPASLLNFTTDGSALPNGNNHFNIVVTLASTTGTSVSLAFTSVTFTILQV